MQSWPRITLILHHQLETGEERAEDGPDETALEGGPAHLLAHVLLIARNQDVLDGGIQQSEQTPDDGPQQQREEDRRSAHAAVLEAFAHQDQGTLGVGQARLRLRKHFVVYRDGDFIALLLGFAAAFFRNFCRRNDRSTCKISIAFFVLSLSAEDPKNDGLESPALVHRPHDVFGRTGALSSYYVIRPFGCLVTSLWHWNGIARWWFGAGTSRTARSETCENVEVWTANEFVARPRREWRGWPSDARGPWRDGGWSGAEKGVHKIGN